MRNLKGRLALSLVLVAGFSTVTSAEETRQEVAGKVFDRGGRWRFWFGDGYRKAWTTPVELPVLDLHTEAGGLKPLREVGALETVGLALAGANGGSFTFRKLMKEPERTIPKDWLGSEIEVIVHDQTAAAHPAATAIVGSLARSVGIPFYASRVMVMPDDPALGKFRESLRQHGRNVRRVPHARLPGAHRDHLDRRSVEEVARGRPREPGGQPRVRQGPALRRRRRQLGSPPGAVALGALPGQAALGADA